VAAAAPTETGSGVTAPACAGKDGIGGWPTTVGVLVKGTLTVGTVVDGTLTVGMVVDGTLTPGTVAPGTLTPGTLTPGTVAPGTLTAGTLTPATLSDGTASVDAARGTETAPATALTEAPSAAPQRPATTALTVVCRRLRRCAGIFSHRALPSGPPPANAHRLNRTGSSSPRRSR
jgi:hypothetical protein